MKRPAEFKGPLYLGIQRAAEEIRKGQIVGIPTETYYGLAVNPEDPKAVAALFSLKKRPGHKPILLLVSDISQITSYVKSVPAEYEVYIEDYWPGPLTLVFPARDTLPLTLTGGTGTVGIRLTPHPIAKALIDLLGHPITATSANLSSEEPARTAAEVRAIFNDKVASVLDGGPADQGLGSTVLQLFDDKLCVAREGRIQLPGLPVCAER